MNNLHIATRSVVHEAATRAIFIIAGKRRVSSLLYEMFFDVKITMMTIGVVEKCISSLEDGDEHRAYLL